MNKFIILAAALLLCSACVAVTPKEKTAMPLSATEGYVTFHNMQTWYKIVGSQTDPAKLPVICLHGGPGTSHDYLKPLEQLAQTGRQVVFYDQTGCGKSTHPHNPELYTIPLYVEELETLRKTLGIEKFHLYGQSWGGMLAMEYYLAHPENVESLILADSLASVEQWIAEANRLKTQLPQKMQDDIRIHEADGTTDSPDYQAAMNEYYKRFVCRLENWPDYVMASLNSLGQDPEVYATMWGSSEFNATGTLKNWDLRPRLKEIKTPTLVLSGRYDESTPLVSGTIHNGIAGSQWVIFEKSAHMPHVEETELYMNTVARFLTETENAR